MKDFDCLFLIMGILDEYESDEDKLCVLVAMENHATTKHLVSAIHEARFEVQKANTIQVHDEVAFLEPQPDIDRVLSMVDEMNKALLKFL
jgi:hypothetical protein